MYIDGHKIITADYCGKHRTGCVIGTMRKIARWNVIEVVQEYSTIASPKIRQCDVEYLTKLDIRLLEY